MTVKRIVVEVDIRNRVSAVDVLKQAASTLVEEAKRLEQSPTAIVLVTGVAAFDFVDPEEKAAAASVAEDEG